MYDDYRGDGTIWSEFDDAVTYFDGIVDVPLDTITFICVIDWPGGMLGANDDVFFLADPDSVQDVSGAHTGIPGSFFTPTPGMILPAGQYVVTAQIKSGGVVLP
jgi:hypothetical protein